MGLFNFLKPKGKTDPVVTIKAPDNFETTAIKLDIQVFFASTTLQKIEKLTIRLRADPIKRRGQAVSFKYLGEATLSGELVATPEKAAEAGFEIPLDFSPIDSFEIPPENLAVASAEVKAAAAANRTSNYKYFIEVSYKTDSSAEQVLRQPIKLVQPGEIRTG